MSKILVIVESPGKISKISNYLGSNYIVKASFGHIQDLDKKTLSIDVENNFKPLYVIPNDKIKVVKELKNIYKDCKDVIIASDGDREGEAIAFSLANVLNIKNPKRIVFNEITKNALLKAVENPTTINYDMVYSQQTRRILDRLVGYKISPVLWKYLTFNMAKSAGRVQSVVVKIIIDKENEIKNSISQPYFKTNGEFKFKDTKINALLDYRFENENNAKEFLNKINKNTIFKVISVENKKNIRKPSPPFITSTLQQEANKKFNLNVKKTMELAQKLYESGLITYMRTDSPNISKDASEDIKKYIIKTYGKEYSHQKNYSSNNNNSQEAHECIRPTNINNINPDNIDGILNKLYNLIWKRTIASQMSNADIDIQDIKIDVINNNLSILDKYFISTFENITFPGFLIIYNDNDNYKNNFINIKVNDILDFYKIIISEEYTKTPSRYNEASLVKYLEKNGIGRPSTFASIISKVIERKYVEIKNIDGIKKNSKNIQLNNKFKIKEQNKEIIIGKEDKKIIPTEMGNTVNEFMIKNFEPIMDIKFTAKFEKYLDKISIGKANWITILGIFYDMFNPIVDKLLNQQILNNTNNDKLLGEYNNIKIYQGNGKYGLYVKIMGENNKWKYAPIKSEDINIQDAYELLKYPKNIGKIGNAIVSLNKGPYGFYIKFLDKNFSIKDDIDINNIDIDIARKIIDNQNNNSIKTFRKGTKIFNIKNGEYGPYIQIITKTNKKNIPIPKKYDIEKITLDDILNIISK